MSFSFSKRGTIAEVREYVEKALLPWSGEPIGSRLSKQIVAAAVNLELLHFETIGATHVQVEGSGHSDSSNREYRVSVRRDTDAEQAYQREVKEKARASWEQQGTVEGWLPKAEEDGGSDSTSSLDTASTAGSAGITKASGAERRRVS